MHLDTYKQKQADLFDQMEKDFSKGKLPSTLSAPVEDYNNDPRRALTSFGYVPDRIANNIYNNIINPLQSIHPEYYYYPRNTLHTTVLVIKAAAFEPKFDLHDIEKVQQVFAEVTPTYQPITYDLQGIFTLPYSYGIRGYASPNLAELVIELRAKLKEAHVADDRLLASDSVYFGHITFCRKAKRETNPEIEKAIEKLHDIELGTFKLDTINIAESNVSLIEDKTKIHEKYSLA